MNAAQKLAELLFDDQELLCICTDGNDDKVHINLTHNLKNPKETQELMLSDDPDFDSECTVHLLRDEFEGKVELIQERNEFVLTVDDDSFYFQFFKLQEWTVVIEDVIPKEIKTCNCQ